MTTEQDGSFHEWLPTARQTGLSYDGYWRRVYYRGMSPREAATRPKENGGRPPVEASIRQICKRAGVDRRHFYRIRDELTEDGSEVTTEDVIELAKERSRNK